MPRSRRSGNREQDVDVGGSSPTLEEDEELADADTDEDGGNESMNPPPNPTTGDGVRRKKTKKSSKATSDKLCEDDVRFINGGVEACKDHFQWLKKCATTVVGEMAGDPDEKKELKQLMKKFTNVGVEMTEMKLKLEGAVGIGEKAIKNVDMKAVKNMGDEEFLKYLDEFETNALKDYDNWCKKNVGMKQVIKDAEYKQYATEINNIVLGKVNEEEIPASKTDVSSPVPAVDISAMSEGLEALNEYIPTVDPVTRKHFKDPVVNRKCGHIYDYESMMNLIITSNGRSKCPYAGCVNRQGVKEEDLERNEEIRSKVFRRMQEEAL